MTDPTEQTIPPEVLQAAEHKFSRAMIQLFTKGVGFVTNLICQLDRQWEMSIPTADVDGKVLRINPEFFLSLTDDVRVSVLCHEGWHVGYDHMGRLADKDHKEWNYAADYAINQDLKDSGFTVPAEWLQDDKFRDRTADEIYQEITSGRHQPPPQPPGGSNPGQDLKENPDPNAIREILSKAATLSKFDGTWDTVPGQLKDYIDKILNPTLPWERILERHLDQIFQRDMSWSRRNRMFRDVIVPGWAQQNTEWANNIVWNFDVSGSVSDAQIQRFLSECAHVHNTYECERTIVNLFDTQVRETYEFDQNDVIEGMNITGRGGTNLVPAIELAKKQTPKVLIVFSDLECPKYPASKKPSFPVIWLCCDNSSATVDFGEIVHFDA